MTQAEKAEAWDAFEELVSFLSLGFACDAILTTMMRLNAPTLSETVIAANAARKTGRIE